MNIITCYTEIFKATNGSLTTRIDKWKLLGWNLYTHVWYETKRDKAE
jgi:hypothetical protein